MNTIPTCEGRRYIYLKHEGPREEDGTYRIPSSLSPQCTKYLHPERLKNSLSTCRGNFKTNTPLTVRHDAPLRHNLCIEDEGYEPTEEDTLNLGKRMG